MDRKPPAKKSGGAKKAHVPRPLFDAIAEVTGSAPAAPASHIAKVEQALKKESPPVTPDEVREFGARFWKLCPWAARDQRLLPTLNEVQKYIGLLRAANRENRPVTDFRPPPDFDTQPPKDQL